MCSPLPSLKLKNSKPTLLEIWVGRRRKVIFSFYLDKWQRSSDKYNNAKRRLRSSEQSKSKRNKKNTNIRIIIKNLFFFDTVVCYTCLHIFSLISEVSSIFIRSCIEIVLRVTPKETSLCDSIIEINCWLLTANG